MGGASSRIEPCDPESIHVKDAQSEVLNAILAKDEKKLKSFIQDGTAKVQPFPDQNRAQLECAIQEMLITSYAKDIISNDAIKTGDVISQDATQRVQDKGSVSEPAVVVAPDVAEASVEPCTESATTANELHTAAKIGDSDSILMYVLSNGSVGGANSVAGATTDSNPKPSSTTNNATANRASMTCEQSGGPTAELARKHLWARDDFDNIPLYYCCLHGHTLCCAWILLAIGGPEALDAMELDRFTINALNAEVKSLLKGKTSCQEYIRKHNAELRGQTLQATGGSAAHAANHGPHHAVGAEGADNTQHVSTLDPSAVTTVGPIGDEAEDDDGGALRALFGGDDDE